MVRTRITNEPYDLTQLPPMDFGLVDMDFYTRPTEDLIRGVPISGVKIFTTIGCPFKCSFCVSGGCGTS